MATQQVPSSIWQRMIQQSFLSLYDCSDDILDSSEYRQDYDYVFEFSDAIVYLLSADIAREYSNSNIDAAQIREWRKEAVNQLVRRHTQLYLKNENSIAVEKSSLTNKPTYFIGLTSLSIQHQNDKQGLHSHKVEYEYGSQFFAEDCVLDLDDEQSILQIFSHHNFIKLIKQLVTPNDFTGFLQFHRDKLTDLHSFKDESALLQQFLQSPRFFQRAINVQKKLVENNLLDEIETRLVKATEPQQSAFAEELARDIQQKTNMWYQLFDNLVKRYYESGTPLPKSQVELLVDESMYTFTSLVEQILDHKYMERESRWNGYISHQHSYSVFGRHYMIVFYAQYETSSLSATNVRATYKDLLAELNAHLQKPAMDDLFLIGVEFRASETSVNTEVYLDIFHQKGLVINAEMQRLYDQLNELKEQT